MNYYEITFSPTGGTKKVADFLANGLFKEAESIDLSDVNEDFSKFSLTEEDMTIIAVPSYSGRVPSFPVPLLYLKPQKHVPNATSVLLNVL